MAAWCLSTGQSDETWRRLTLREREAFMDLLRKENARG